MYSYRFENVDLDMNQYDEYYTISENKLTLAQIKDIMKFHYCSRLAKKTMRVTVKLDGEIVSRQFCEVYGKKISAFRAEL
jgi:hypothetical protein